MLVYSGIKLYGVVLRKDPNVGKISFIRLPEEEEAYKP